MKPSLLTVWILLLGFVLPHAALAARPDSADHEILNVVVHDVCHRQVAMLGESNTHGDGHTESFKVALVERLINECGFDSVIFEASHYEFLHIASLLRTGQPVSTDQLSAAIGGLWKFDREFQPLVPFLLAKAQSGQISLGGMDDQLGQLGQDYANVRMIAEWASLLLPPQQQECSLALHRRVYSDYTPAAPYSESNRSQISACLAQIRLATASKTTTDRSTKQEQLEMISAAQRWIGRDFTSEADQTAGRDRSMYRNFAWLRQRQPLRHKIIVWSATVHIAKVPDVASAVHQGRNFGSYVHQSYGPRAFSLGFSVLTGSYRAGRKILNLPAAPPDSLEAQSLGNSSMDAIYLNSAQLAASGTRPAAAYRHSYETLRWSGALDGMVVFREERPPASDR